MNRLIAQTTASTLLLALAFNSSAGGDSPQVADAEQAIESASASPHADNTSAEHELAARLLPIDALQASFTQQQLAADGYLIRETHGEMQLQRPGKMRWVSAPPYEQWVISNGERLWIFDPDLEQVSIHSVAKQAGGSPILLLAGDVERLADEYQIQQQGERFTLTPRQANSAYERVILEFQQQAPASIEVVDSLGERTAITFSQVMVNPSLSGNLFEFTPPADVDVIQND